MTTSASDLILATMNGLSLVENAKLQTGDMIDRITPLLGKLHRLPPKQSLTSPEETKLRDAITELQLHLQSAKDFDELASWIPLHSRVFQTRSEEVYAGGSDEIYMFVEIPVDNVMGDVMRPPYVSIPLHGERLYAKITPEQAQDFMTMRYSDRPITEEEEKLLLRLMAIDRYSVLKLWVDGYPVHAGYNNELEYVKPCDFLNLEDVGLRYAVRYTSQQDKTNLILNEGKPGLRRFNYNAGRCVPDHTCCAKGMWSDEVRREFIKKPLRDQEHLQQKDLLGRMRDMYASNPKK